jgi:hypothetical protein
MKRLGALRLHAVRSLFSRSADRAEAGAHNARARRRASGIALALLAACAGCRQPPRKAEVYEPPPVEVTTPAWVSQPLSWAKLEALESWLEYDAHRHEPFLVLEGQLVLSEGRLHFSQRDRDRSSAPADTLRLRIEGARDGFKAVNDDVRASPGQKRRAEIGLRATQALLGAPAGAKLTAITRDQWGARNANPSSMTAHKGGWSKITVHHSAETSTDPAGGSIEESMASLRGIQRYHVEEKGWGDIGYHFLVDAAGRIFEGRALNWQGAHAGGANNPQNIGVCLLGDLERRAPTPAALKSLELLVGDLRQRYRIREGRLYAHRELNVTTCPGDALTSWIKAHR